MGLRVEQTELKSLNYPLYLCTSFVSPSNQGLLQDLLSLSCNLTNAVIQPSEQMLKAIRVQWWIDCITELQKNNSPLSDRIISYICDGRLNKEKILSIIENFQKASFADSSDEYLKVCWSSIFDYYCVLSNQDRLESINLLGSLISYIAFNPEKLEKLIKNRDIYREMNVISLIKSKDGFIKSCVYLLVLTEQNKLKNFKFLPFRLFLNMLLKK